jgi:hypothetical protein
MNLVIVQTGYFESVPIGTAAVHFRFRVTDLKTDLSTTTTRTITSTAFPSAGIA